MQGGLVTIGKGRYVFINVDDPGDPGWNLLKENLRQGQREIKATQERIDEEIRQEIREIRADIALMQSVLDDAPGDNRLLATALLVLSYILRRWLKHELGVEESTVEQFCDEIHRGFVWLGHLSHPKDMDELRELYQRRLEVDETMFRKAVEVFDQIGMADTIQQAVNSGDVVAYCAECGASMAEDEPVRH